MLVVNERLYRCWCYYDLWFPRCWLAPLLVPQLLLLLPLQSQPPLLYFPLLRCRTRTNTDPCDTRAVAVGRSGGAHKARARRGGGGGESVAWPLCVCVCVLLQPCLLRCRPTPQAHAELLPARKFLLLPLLPLPPRLFLLLPPFAPLLERKASGHRFTRSLF
jgi:hypothetical protein